MESTLRKELGEKLFTTKVRVNTKAKTAPSLRQTIFEYEEAAFKKKAGVGRGSEDYAQLAEEIVTRLELPAPPEPVRNELGGLAAHG